MRWKEKGMEKRQFNIVMKGLGVAQVQGRFTKLKGYSKLKLFSHKLDKIWFIREFYSGRELGNSNTEANAKKDAKTYLAEYTLQEIQNQIDSLDQVNKD